MTEVQAREGVEATAEEVYPAGTSSTGLDHGIHSGVFVVAKKVKLGERQWCRLILDCRGMNRLLAASPDDSGVDGGLSVMRGLVCVAPALLEHIASRKCQELETSGDSGGTPGTHTRAEGRQPAATKAVPAPPAPR